VSVASLKALRGLIERGKADLATIDAWEAKKAVTAAEADEARAYWHELYDPPPAPEPTPEQPATETPAETPAAAEQPVEDSATGGQDSADRA
jgi:hypothetical protein